MVDTTTGELRSVYSSRRELDGYTYVRCGNRREAECPSCSHEYKGDAWHLLVAGLAGGKGVPAQVEQRPSSFLTLTAPSFGGVHGLRERGSCRPRRDKPVCEHGRPQWCSRRHVPGDEVVGQPLCRDCYDYEAHVLWQWYAPGLWRRFVIRLRRVLAATAGITPKEFQERARVAYSKVTEYQARGMGVVTFSGPG